MSAGTKKYGGEKLSSYKKHQDEAPYGKEHAYKDCDCKVVVACVCLCASRGSIAERPRCNTHTHTYCGQ